MNEITYHREGDYLIPDLYLPKQPEKSIGKHGRLRLNFIKEYKKGLYTELLINGTLKQHLIEIDESATDKVNELIKQLAELEHIDENLKEHHQMEWVQAMNSIKNRAEEIVFDEILYV
ncbi:MAG: TnpV protein [Clostridia bacterium]|nr:TnpV protein [Clostridia bacterium]